MTEPVEIRLVRLEERIRASEEALRLQAVEYDRRLADLNHAHKKALLVQHTYVTSEKFEDFVTHYDADKQAIAKALTLAEGKSRGLGQFAAIVIGGLGVLSVAVSLILVIGDILTP